MDRSFFIVWIVANVIGFTIGNILGNGAWGLVLGSKGDLLSSAVFGGVQAIILSRYIHVPNRRSFLWWVVATVLGFMIGVYIAKRVTPFNLEAQYAVMAGLIFGLATGLPVTVLQWASLRWQIIKQPSKVNGWLVASMAAWLIGEALTPIFGNVLAYMPVFGLIYALTTVFFWQRRAKDTPHDVNFIRETAAN